MSDADLAEVLDDYAQCDHYACHGWVPILVAEVRRLRGVLAGQGDARTDAERQDIDALRRAVAYGRENDHHTLVVRLSVLELLLAAEAEVRLLLERMALIRSLTPPADTPPRTDG